SISIYSRVMVLRSFVAQDPCSLPGTYSPNGIAPFMPRGVIAHLALVVGERVAVVVAVVEWAAVTVVVGQHAFAVVERLRAAVPAEARAAARIRSAASGQRFAVIVVQRLDTLDADEPIAVVETNQPNALRVPAEHGDLRRGRAHQRSGGRNKHDLVVERDLQRRDALAVALRRADRDYTLSAAALHGELLD